MMEGAGESRCRISRLVRTLSRAESKEVFLESVSSIENQLKVSENRKYVQKSFTPLATSLVDAFKILASGIRWRTEGVAALSSLLLSFAESMEGSSSRLYQWLIDLVVKRGRNGRCGPQSTLRAIHDVLFHMMGEMNEGSKSCLTKILHGTIEEVDSAPAFKVLSALFVASLSSSVNHPHFHDFVDVVIGWMVDEETANGDHCEFCARLLLLLRSHFQEEPSFPRTLLNQIVEDMEAALKGISTETPTSAVKRILLLSKAFNAMLRTECFQEKEFLIECCERMIGASLQVLNGVRPCPNSKDYMLNLILSVSEILYLVPNLNGQFTRTFIKTQLSYLKSDWSCWPSYILDEFWCGLCSWIEASVSVTHLTEDTEQMCQTLMDLVDEMEGFGRGKQSLSLVHSLLRTRNVPLLQKVYHWLIEKLTKTENTEINMQERKLFVIAGISEIAVNRSGSILSLWALEPSIAKFLMDIVEREEEIKLKTKILDLLRSHCTIHKHFLSSIATTGSFSSDSPGARFLPHLMSYWIEELKKEVLNPTHRKWKETMWLWEWLEEFLEASSAYSLLLVKANSGFFTSLFSLLTQLIVKKKTVHELSFEKAKTMVLWFICDPNYSKLELIQDLVQAKCLQMLRKQTLPSESQEAFLEIVSSLPLLIVSQETLPATLPSSIQKSSSNDAEKPLTATGFTAFLHELLLGASNEDQSQQDTTLNVNSAVNHLIRSKLRTPLGKPQELFGQIQNVFKKRSSEMPFPKWKLNFMLELERAFILAIHGSSVVESTIPETVRSFYVTNRSPCMEWLKRMRADLTDVAFIVRDYSMAFYNSSLAMDNEKASIALFYLHDGEGLKGLGEQAGWHYVQGDFEEALEILTETESGEENTLLKLIQERAASALSSFDPVDKSSQNKQIETWTGVIPRTLFEHQAVRMKEAATSNKSMLNFVTPASELSLWNLLTLNSVIRRNPDLMAQSDTVQSLQLLTLKKMLKHGNIDFVERWLNSQGIPWSRDVELSPETLDSIVISARPKQLQTLAEISLMNNQYPQAAKIYEQFILNAEEFKTASELQCSSEAIVDVALKTQDYRSFFELLVGDVLVLPSELTDAREREKKVLEELYLKALRICPTNKSAWLAYGNFHYDLTQDYSNGEFELDTFKRGAVDSYTNYLRLSGIDGSEGQAITKVISRLLSLYAEGYEFEAEEVILTNHWLDFVPQIAQLPSLRIHILRRFPQETSLFLYAYDSSDPSWKPPLKRKALFEPMAFGLTEVCDEPFMSIPSTNSSILCGCEPSRGFAYALRSPLNIPDEVRLLAKEVLRVGSSLEEIWSWNLQRVLLDWNRRVGALKRDLARNPDPLKVKNYILPVVEFLQGLWSDSEKNAESSAEIAFIARNREILPAMFRNLSNCTSVDAVVGSFERILFHVDTFDSYVGYKSSLSYLSPKLANFQEICGASNPISLPGLPTSVHLVSIEPLVVALATKTKPKKVKFRASNGMSYEYLVKGNENLNVDSAVMQFLSLTSRITNCPTWTYSVTPLGKRGGLIQMVEGALPIFVLYKKYLQRNNSAERTSEMFWRRMNTYGSSDRSNLQHLKDAYTSLRDETPDELISRELLLCSKDINGWFNAVRMFTRDMGVSSAVGYILGIGDRHLDNILVNLHQGKLIHVDFSLMFDKGTSLRVPEVVPFRLTQNFSKALQFPGAKGPFSVYLEDTLNKFSQERELILGATKTISFATQLEEDCPISPEVILLAEINSTLAIARFRKNDIWNTAKRTKKEILEKCTELSNKRQNLCDCKRRLESCEQNIESLTVALSELKAAQIDMTRLTSLRSLCHATRCEQPQTSILGPQQALAFYSENFLKKSVITENDVQWANSLEKVISSQLQNELQTKFNLGEEGRRLEKDENELLGTLHRRLNRWRRVLGNIDPLVAYLCSIVKEDSKKLGPFKAMVDSHWIPNAAHFWLHSTVEELIESSDQFVQQFELVESTLEEIFFSLDSVLVQDQEVGENELEEIDPVEDILQINRIQTLINTTNDKITGINSTVSVDKLIDEATSVDNLAQMYEGWTPWV